MGSSAPVDFTDQLAFSHNILWRDETQYQWKNDIRTRHPIAELWTDSAVLDEGFVEPATNTYVNVSQIVCATTRIAPGVIGAPEFEAQLGLHETTNAFWALTLLLKKPYSKTPTLILPFLADPNARPVQLPRSSLYHLASIIYAPKECLMIQLNRISREDYEKLQSYENPA